MIESCKNYWRAKFDSIVEDFPKEYKGLEWCLSHFTSEKIEQSMGSILSQSMWLINYLNGGKNMRWATCEDVKRANSLVEDVRQYLSKHLTIFTPCFALESSATIQRYRRYVILLDDTPEDVIVDELGNCIVTRDVVESYLQASVLLHKDLLVSEEMKSLVNCADNQLRVIAPMLWRRAGVVESSMTEEERCQQCIESSSGNWWWWLHKRNR